MSTSLMKLILMGILSHSQDVTNMWTVGLQNKYHVLNSCSKRKQELESLTGKGTLSCLESSACTCILFDAEMISVKI